MADHLQITVSVVPIEELTDENSGTTKIVASEVATSLSGSGDSIDLANYSGTAGNQGYANGAVNYLDAIHTSEGTKLSATEPCDAAFIKNTGHKFSTTSLLGAPTTDYVMVVYKTLAFITSTQSGWTPANTDTPTIHYFMIGWLAPGQAMVLPGGITTANNKYDLVSGNSFELSYINADALDQGDTQIYCKTFQSDGTVATDGNAVEYLVVT